MFSSNPDSKTPDLIPLPSDSTLLLSDSLARKILMRKNKISKTLTGFIFSTKKKAKTHFL